MAGRSRDELEAIRRENRRALGMSGVPGLGACSCGGTCGGCSPGVPPSGESSQVGEWFNRHILRPFVEVGPVRYSPGDGYEDYSGIARIFAYLASAFGVATGLWILQRAFFPGARS